MNIFQEYSGELLKNLNFKKMKIYEKKKKMKQKRNELFRDNP